AINSSKLFVEPALKVRLERAPVQRVRGKRVGGLVACSGPAPGEYADHGPAAEEADERQGPGEEVEPVPRRGRQDPRPPLLDELVLDLAPGRALVDPPRDVALDPLRRRGVRL